MFKSGLNLLRRKGDFRAPTVGRPEMTDTRNSDAPKMVTAPYFYSCYVGFFDSAGKCVCLALTILLLPRGTHFLLGLVVFFIFFLNLKQGLPPLPAFSLVSALFSNCFQQQTDVQFKGE